VSLAAKSLKLPPLDTRQKEKGGKKLGVLGNVTDSRDRLFKRNSLPKSFGDAIEAKSGGGGAYPCFLTKNESNHSGKES